MGHPNFVYDKDMDLVLDAEQNVYICVFSIRKCLPGSLYNQTQYR